MGKPELQFDRYSSCSICLEEFENGEKLVKLPCSHYFHPDCINPWLTERQPTCPLCKANVKHDLERKRRQMNGQYDDDETYNSDASQGCCCFSPIFHCIESCLFCCCTGDNHVHDADGEGEYINISTQAQQRSAGQDGESADIISSNSPESIHSPLLENEYDVL